jgi:dipeptidyl aminopeptidase/acylaminoacyl peptidase
MAFWLTVLLAASAELHPFSIHDMLAMQRISDLNVSPEGEKAVFVLRTTDLEANRGRTDLWLLPLIGTLEPQQLTTHPASDFNPRWSADGQRIWFLSSRGDSTQVWSIGVAGGEARQETDLALPVGSLGVSPRGNGLVLSMSVFPGKSVAETVADLERIEQQPTTGKIYDKLFVRHWDTWKDGRRAHVFYFDVKTREALDLMAQMDADCPTQPFGGPEDYTFSGDGQSVVFTARDAGEKEAWSTDFDLYAVDIAGGNLRCLTEDNPAWDSHPVFSADGKWLAYLAMQRAGYESDRNRIVVRNWQSGEQRVLTEDWDRSPWSLSWSNDGRRIFATADHLGQRALFSIDVASGTVRPLLERGTVRGFGPSADRLIVAMDHLRSPVELYSVPLRGGETQRLTYLNDERLKATRMGQPEQFQFKGWNDEPVYCYVVKPADFDSEKSYPVAFLIHGGPQGSFGNDFHYRWNPQVYAAAGYAAVMVDFHGSVGYGQAFTDSIRGDWGGKPLVDLQKGLAAALERYPWMDGERVSALGASYGGYMINWISGVWPDRFRCMVNHDGNLDERMAYYDTEELWFPEWERSGTPWENPEAYQHHNPIDHVGKWQTPMLVIHGALDYRVVDTQGLSTFTALQRRGVPSKLLYFPDENHWVLQPHNSILWHETVLGWIHRWTLQ